jgi:predicted ATPase
LPRPETTHNPPVALTTFIGRDAELDDIEQLVAERRLVTLTGVGGCGKTRPVLRLGERLADRWPDGFWLVDLGSVTDPALVPGLVASAAGALVEPGGDEVQALAAQLGSREMLLCLDTCEHLLDATADLADTVLRRCPGVTPLAAVGVVLLMAGAIFTHLRRREAQAVVVNLAVLALAGIVVWGRFGPQSFIG